MDKDLKQSYFMSKKFNKKIIFYNVAIILVILGLILINVIFTKTPKVKEIYNKDSVVAIFENTNQPGEITVNGPNSSFVKSFYDTVLFYPENNGNLSLSYSKEPSVNVLSKILEKKPINEEVDKAYLSYCANIYTIIQNSKNPEKNLSIISSYMSKNSGGYIQFQSNKEIEDKVNEMDLSQNQKESIIQNLMNMMEILNSNNSSPF